MKKLLFLPICLCLLGMVFESCNRNNSLNKSSPLPAIAGTWVLRERSGGMRPASTYPAENGSRLTFTKNRYQVFEAGQMIKSGTYKLVGDTTVEASVCLVLPKGEFQHRIIYDGDYNETKVFVHVAGNILSLISGCYAYDAGHKETYEKQTNK